MTMTERCSCVVEQDILVPRIVVVIIMIIKIIVNISVYVKARVCV